MKLASHNSLTYLKVGFWSWFIKWTAKCQSKTIQQQYEDYGVRLFDLRIWFDKDFNLEVRHGIIKYKIKVEQVRELLRYLNEKGDCWVRLILEENNTLKKKSYAVRNENIFIFLCECWEKTYANIKFFGGMRKFDWKVLYAFQNLYPDIKEYNTSGLWPWIGARLHNKKNRKNHTDDEQWAMMDFVNIV